MKLTIGLVLLSFIVSTEGNAFGCIFPFTMNFEKTPLKCEASLSVFSSAPLAAPSDLDCKDSLFKEGQINQVKSTFDGLILRNLPEVSTVAMIFPNPSIQISSGSVRFLQDFSPHFHHSSIPLYTINRSFLI